MVPSRDGVEATLLLMVGMGSSWLLGRMASPAALFR
jgi:hypothetical protein